MEKLLIFLKLKVCEIVIVGVFAGGLMGLAYLIDALRDKKWVVILGYIIFGFLIAAIASCLIWANWAMAGYVQEYGWTSFLCEVRRQLR